METMTLRLTNISEETNARDLRKLLAKYGAVLRLQIQWEKCGETCAFFVLRAEDAEDALQFLDGKEWRGLPLQLHKHDSGWFCDGDNEEDDDA